MTSGDLAAHAHAVRKILDDGGLPHVKILASGNLDEYALQELAAAPIDGYGIGTLCMNTSTDAPYLECAYKITGIQRSSAPQSIPRANPRGPAANKSIVPMMPPEKISEDVMTLENDAQQGKPLLGSVHARREAGQASEFIDGIACPRGQRNGDVAGQLFKN